MLKKIAYRLTGFSVIGAMSTLVSLLLIYLFIGILETPLFPSYVTIYIVTIYLSYHLNTRFVFKVNKSFFQAVKYFMAYGSGMLVGIVFISVFKRFYSLEDWVVSCFSIPVTTMWNFICVSMVLDSKQSLN